MQTRVLPVRRTVVALVGAAVLVALAACTSGTSRTGDGRSSPSTTGNPAVRARESNGWERLTAQQIYDKSRAANASAGSYRERMTRADARTDLLLSANECSGTVEITGLGAFDVIRKDGDVWAKLDPATATWASEQGGIAVPEETWLHGRPEHPLMARLASWCHAGKGGKPDGAKLSGVLMRGDVTTLEDGQQAIPVSIEANRTSVTWYVAAVGKPYLLRQDAASADMENITYTLQTLFDAARTFGTEISIEPEPVPAGWPGPSFNSDAEMAALLTAKTDERRPLGQLHIS
ncbi:hypothetical protein ACQEV9_45470 [Streptomyces chartreusis]|uniref:hypothetical protein n=1 Tax=Streptomyces chartreusis TaxID=1969 RepID=UPI003D90A350